jgi:predicted AlkP superfamily pyrophosphatase or phosphodiesterase
MTGIGNFARHIFVVVAVGFMAVSAAAFVPPGQTVILVSIDGFRADYLDRGLTPTLSFIADHGVKAAMRPAFPSLTFPNHYTLVTGLYPDHHGIVDNTMNDPSVSDHRFTLSDPYATGDRKWWDQATPLWVTAQRQGLHAATMFWPGSDADIQGVRPDHWEKFNKNMLYVDRVDTVLGWLDLPADQRPRLLTLYFDHVDDAGHRSGPESTDVNDALAEADAIIGRLLKGIGARGLADQTDVIIVADHGMIGVSPERAYFIDDYISAGGYSTTGGGAMIGVTPRPGHEQEVAAALLTPKRAMEHMVCRRKEDMPERLHYGSNARIPPLLCLADPGWTVEMAPREGKGNAHPHKGTHGYDNQAPEMAALFIAAGPAFKQGLVHPAFDNVDVYPLMAKVLGLAPEPNDGRLDDVKDMLN